MKNTKENLYWLWQNAENVLIVTFFLTFTLNIRKVFLTPYSFLNGGFNEYMTMSFSWADVLMLAIIAIYTTKLILRQVINPYYASSGHEKVFKIVSRETFYLLIFLAWAGLSIFWSQYQPIAAYRFLTLIEIAFFAFIAVKSLNSAKWLKLAFFAIILNGLFQSLLGIAQFIHNGSLGIRFLGESIIGSNIDGVAKIIINGEKHIRAYGTLPHPNILAGFLLVPLFIIISEFVQRKFALTSSRPSSCQCEPHPNPLLIKERESVNLPPLNKGRAGVGSDNVPHETFLDFLPKWIWYAILLIIGLGFFLTFSRSAFLGLFVGLIIFAWQTKKHHHILSPFSKGGLRGISAPESGNPSPAPCPKCFAYQSRRVPLRKEERQKYLMLLCSLVCLLLAFLYIINNTSFFSNQSLQERTLYQNVSYETFLKHPLAGVGIGQFVMNEYQTHPNLESWQYQPVHNVYFLAFSELGIAGLIFFLLWIFSIMKWGIGKNGNTDLLRSLLLTRLSFYCIILSFLFIAFFDHHFWDIKSGTLIFILPLVLTLALVMNSKKCSTDFFGLL